MKNALYVLLGVMAGFVLAGVLVFVSRAPAGESIILRPAPTASPIAVHVIGAVPRPGLYEFPEGARVQDAIDAAGGLLASANVDALNLAALLEDGQQLNIPFKEGSEPTDDTSTFDLPSSATATPTTDNSENNNSTVELININTASLEELVTLPSIGEVNGQKIIDYREENGAFSTIEDIIDVPGIGTSIFEDIQEFDHSLMPQFDHFGFIAPLYARSTYSQTKIMSEVAELPVKGRLLDVGGGTGRVSSAIRDLVEKLLLMRSHFLAPDEIMKLFTSGEKNTRVEDGTAWISIKKDGLHVN